MKKILLAIALLAVALPSLAHAQSNPHLTQGQVLTPAQWNNLFAGKQDTLGYTPMNNAGGTFSGRIVTAPPGASTSGFNLTPGSTPASPANGDLWATSGGLFARINGTTIGPIAGNGGPIASGHVIANATGSSALAADTAPSTWFDRAWCGTVGSGVFKSTGEWKCDRSIPVPITLFGAVADSGVTDNVTFIQATVDYAAANGLGIKIPRSNGYFGAGCGRNNAMIDMTSLTVPNGNKSVSIFGDGWSEKPFATPTGSWILPTSSFPNTCSYIRLSGSDKVSSTVYEGFGLGEFGGSLGTPKGLHGIFWDASNPAYYQQNMKINNVYIGNMAAGYSFKCTTNSGATPGCIPDSSITNSKFMSFNADFLADHVTIGPQNTIAQNATIDARDVGIEFAQCDGCTSVVVVNNNISSSSGQIRIHGANTPIIRDNEMESGGVNLNGAMVDLIGDQAVIAGAVLTGNQLAQNSTASDVAPIRVQNAISTQIFAGRIGLIKATPYDYVTMTGAAAGTFLGYNRCSYNNLFTAVNDLTCSVSSLGGANGFQHTPYGFSLPGTSDGRAIISTQAHAGAAVLLVPTISGTLASAGLSPIAVTVAGLVTCSTCATTSGANIPAVATGDILYGSAANVLSALADVATGNALISGGVGVAPSWGKISLATHVTGTLQATNAPAFTGDITSSAGSLITTLATVNVNVGAFGSSTSIPTLTVNGKGLITAVSGNAVIAPAGTLSGATLASNVLASSLTSVGTLTGGATGAGFTVALGTSTITGALPCANHPALTGDVTTSVNSCVTAIGATKVVSAMLNADVFSTAHSWGIQTFATPVINGLATGTGVAAAATASTLVARDGAAAITATNFIGAGTGLTGTAAGLTAGGNVTSVVCNGVTITASGTCPEPMEFENCSFAASVAANILTVAMKDGAGATPSATSPCRIGFANATASTGSSTFNSVTGALSIDTNATGASLGSLNSTAFRFWIAAFDNSGTTVLSLYNASTAATGCGPIDESSAQSSTPMSGSATAAKTFYTPNGTTVSSKSIRLLGYVEYGSSGLATAGTYASAPATVRTFTKGMKRPCDEVQLAYGEAASTTSSSTSSSFGTGAAPANSPIATITPKSAANLVHAIWSSSIQTNAGSLSIAYCQLYRGASGAVNTAVGSLSVVDTNVAGSTLGGANGQALDGPNVNTAIQYALRVRNSDNVTTVSCPTGNGTANIVLKEIQG